MRWLITGASGALGGYLIRELGGESVVAWSGTDRNPPFIPVDLADRDSMAAAVRAAKPDIVVHAAAKSRVDACFRDPSLAFRVNAEATEQLCELAGHARLIYVSTDMVFDGEHAPYRETDAPMPLSVYGRTKAAGEAGVRRMPAGVVARLSLLFGQSAQPTFFSSMLDALRSGRETTLFTDEWRTPLGLAAAARMLVALARTDFTGTIHLAGPDRMSRFEMGRRLARHLKLGEASLIPTQRDSIRGVEPRPRDVSLDTTLWRSEFPSILPPSFEESLTDMLRE